MNKRKLLMALVGACLACNVAMANAAGVEYMCIKNFLTR